MQTSGTPQVRAQAWRRSGSVVSGDRTAFDVHMAKVRTLPEATTRAVTVDGRLVGSIASFVVNGDTEVTYWIDRSFWG